jgi:hypothetical protein
MSDHPNTVLLRTGLAQASRLSNQLTSSRHTVQEIACTAACLLARAAWEANRHLAQDPNHASTYPALAHAFLDDVLADCELWLCPSEGQA